MPGCTRYVQWGKKQFIQADKCCDYAAQVRPFIRTIDAYDGFSTVGHFDLLWVSPEVRDVYARAFACRRGVPNAQAQAFADGIFKKFDDSVYFYLLMPDTTQGLQPCMDSKDPMSRWAVVLCNGETEYTPTDIRKIDLDPEIKVFFGKRFNKYRILYFVVFDRYSEDGTERFTQSSYTMSIRSSAYNVQACWRSDEAQKVVCE